MKVWGEQCKAPVTLVALGLQAKITVYNKKKLRYREEHSASVVFSWCTLWSGDYQQINS